MRSLRLLSSLAFASTLSSIGPDFETSFSGRLDTTLLPTALLLPRIRGGERADVALLTAEGLEALVAEDLIDGSSRVDLARSRVGIAVQTGARRPVIDSEASLVAALMAARSVAISRSGASGVFFAGLLDRLGVAEAVYAKAVVIESGYTAALAADGRVELAVQQVSELLMVPGVDLVGPLPPGLDGESVFSGGVFVGAAEASLGAHLLRVIAAADGVLRKSGLAPM